MTPAVVGGKVPLVTDLSDSMRTYLAQLAVALGATEVARRYEMDVDDVRDIVATHRAGWVRQRRARDPQDASSSLAEWEENHE